MKMLQSVVYGTVVLSLMAAVPTPAQNGTAATSAPAARQGEAPLRSHIFIYDLRTGKSTPVYTADVIWEAPNWSPDGKWIA